MALTLQFPELRNHLYTEQGKLRAFVNVYLNDEDIRYLAQKEYAPVKDQIRCRSFHRLPAGLPTAANSTPPMY